jgi:hypothetical protein
MREFFKDFAGPIATIVASVVATVFAVLLSRGQQRIAQTQADVSIEKLKLDLFDKRYTIYSAAKQLIEHLTQKSDFKALDHMKIRALYVTLDEGRFFLPQTLREFLSHLQQASEEFIKVLADRANLSTDDAKAWSATADEAAALNAKLRGIYKGLPTRFEEVLSFKAIEHAASDHR